MSLSSKYKTDKTLERTGVRIEFPVNADGTVPYIDILRASRSNPNYQVVADRINAPHRRAEDMGILPPAKREELTREIYAEAGIKGWGNILLSDVTGNPEDEGYADFSKANAIALFTNLPDLYQSLVSLSIEHSTFLVVEKERAAKNSAMSLPTILTTVGTTEQ